MVGGCPDHRSHAQIEAGQDLQDLNGVVRLLISNAPYKLGDRTASCGAK
jgi:hypothetical protein